MIVCHCQRITDHDIHVAINLIRFADPKTLITPGKVRCTLGKPANCGGCMSLFIQQMRRNPNLEIPIQIKDQTKEEVSYARR